MNKSCIYLKIFKQGINLNPKCWKLLSLFLKDVLQVLQSVCTHYDIHPNICDFLKKIIWPV